MHHDEYHRPLTFFLFFSLDWKVAVWISAPARNFHRGVSVIPTILVMACIHYFNPCVRCIVWLYICFKWERCNMSSINKRLTDNLGQFNFRTKLFGQKTCRELIPWEPDLTGVTLFNGSSQKRQFGVTLWRLGTNGLTRRRRDALGLLFDLYIS